MTEHQEDRSQNTHTGAQGVHPAIVSGVAIVVLIVVLIAVLITVIIFMVVFVRAILFMMPFGRMLIAVPCIRVMGVLMVVVVRSGHFQAARRQQTDDPQAQQDGH